MIFHEDTVLVGDKVFDVNRGAGVVINVTEKLFEVNFGYVRIFYDEKGVQKDKVLQTLFWNKPYVIAPRKNQIFAQEQIRRFNAVLDLIKTFS